MEITLIRHAQTENNQKQVFMGDLDVGCSDDGIKEVQKCCERVNRKLYDKYFTSPLLRAKMTAEILFPDRDIVEDVRLKERGLGIWSGKSKEFIREKYPEAFVNGYMDLYYTPQNGEEYIVFVERSLSFLIDVIENYENKSIVVVSHNGVIRILKAMLLKIPFKKTFESSEPHIEPQTYQIYKRDLQQIEEFVKTQIYVK